MKLIKEIESRRGKDKHLRRWGKFLCPFCLQEVEKLLSNGLKANSCGCVSHKLQSEAIKGKNNPFYGKKHTEEARKKISIANKGRESPNKGKHPTEETKNKQSERMKGRFIGENNPNYGISRFGEDNSNWQGGKSFEEYPQEFKQIKKSILERDNYKCQYPNCTEIHDRLHVHHIDYNKTNNNPENLITLGTSCHTKTNGNRSYWTIFYQNIMINRILECLL